MDTLSYGQTISAEAIVPGKVLAGRYHLIERIGSGGMGDVWRAADREMDDMPVAIKVLPAILAHNERSIADLRREAAIAIRLSHPHICRLHTFHSDGSIKFLSMEFIEGLTLEMMLSERPGRRLAWSELLPLVRQIGSALDYAHGITPPVLHRDIKPGNIMVTPGGTAKLLDFGIAREIRNSMTRVTGREDTSGTLPYMSPEQFRGERCDGRSDVYSFCSVIYEALAGMPFVSPSGSVAWQVQEKLFQPLAGAPAEANRLLAAGLAKRPQERPTNIVSVIETTEPSGSRAPELTGLAPELHAAIATPVVLSPVAEPPELPATRAVVGGPPPIPAWAASPAAFLGATGKAGAIAGKSFSVLWFAVLLALAYAAINAGVSFLSSRTGFGAWAVAGISLAQVAVTMLLIRRRVGPIKWRYLLILSVPWILMWVGNVFFREFSSDLGWFGGLPYQLAVCIYSAGVGACAGTVFGIILGRAVSGRSVSPAIMGGIGWASALVLLNLFAWVIYEFYGELGVALTFLTYGLPVSVASGLLMGLPLGLTIGWCIKLAWHRKAMV
ncbi:MAG: serine/threonine-protein kinase [Planctomycetota bacterium]|nr:serine/threonine-protein kinase [Planctomycetota bacterium]